MIASLMVSTSSECWIRFINRFNKKFDNQGPPFGGFYEEYIELFSNLFIIEKLENSVRSVHPRKENEFWIKMRKK